MRQAAAEGNDCEGIVFGQPDQDQPSTAWYSANMFVNQVSAFFARTPVFSDMVF
jgi:hypothetical protein